MATAPHTIPPHTPPLGSWGAWGVSASVSRRFDRPREHAYHDRQGMNRKQRENTSKLLYDIVKFALVGIIFVNFVPGKDINWVAMFTGMIIAILAYSLAYQLDSKED